MAIHGEVILRQRVCRGSGCHAVFWICPHCDRGQRYCSLACRAEARLQQRRCANCRHQRSPEGRMDQARVTDQGSLSIISPALCGCGTSGTTRTAQNWPAQQPVWRGHVRAFQDWGGQPRVILYDNLRSAVLERRSHEIHFNPRLLELCAHYHFVARPCQVRAGNQKGRVERAIRYVRDSFWAGRAFTTPPA